VLAEGVVVHPLVEEGQGFVTVGHGFLGDGLRGDGA